LLVGEGDSADGDGQAGRRIAEKGRRVTRETGERRKQSGNW